jgi:hypothetical protein
MSSLNVSKMIKILENNINTLGNTVKTLENTVKTQGNTIKTQSVMLRNQGVSIQDLRLKVSKIPKLENDITNLEKLNKVLAGEVNAINARIYARAKLERLSVPTQKGLGNYTHYKNKVSRWHNTFHGRHFTENQIKQMKSNVGKTYTKRKQIPRPPGSNMYGSMKTDSLKAVQYAAGRKSDKASSHAPSIKSPSKY